MPEHGVEGQPSAERHTVAFGGVETYDDKYRVPNFFSYSERVYRPFVRAVVKKAGLVPGQYVLDAGCGQGFFSSLLAENGLRVVGVDTSAEGIAAARASYKGELLDFIRGDLLKLPYEQSFDGIFVRSCSLYNDIGFSHDNKVTLQLLSYLRPGGILVFDYYSRLNKRAISHAWRYHDLEATRAHFAAFERAQICFSLRAECAILGARSFGRWSSRFAELVSTYTTLGGEIVVFLRHEPDAQRRPRRPNES
jgi:SAM-dependent methyltransferase